MLSFVLPVKESRAMRCGILIVGVVSLEVV